MDSVQFQVHIRRCPQEMRENALHCRKQIGITCCLGQASDANVPVFKILKEQEERVDVGFVGL